MRAERVGVFGGTFDPPHAGHVAAARACRDGLALDRVLLVVANDPWQKSPGRVITPAEDRYEMVVALAEGEDGIEPSRLELDRGGPSYTIDTVEALRDQAGYRGLPSPELFVVVGSDLVGGLPTWKRVDDLRHLADLVVVARPGSPVPPVPAGWTVVAVEADGVDVSSSEVRALLAEGRSVDGLVPEAVMRCIRRRHLYAVTR